MRILAVDPGTTQSAWVFFDSANGLIDGHGIIPNEEMLDEFADNQGHFRDANYTVFEQVSFMGMAVGREVFETVFWTGRFYQAVLEMNPDPSTVSRVTRRTVKLYLCGSAQAKDANIRQALIDKFGGKARAVGTKKAPGPLYGIKSHEWAALALAVTVAD